MNTIEKITESITGDAKAYAEDVLKNAEEHAKRLTDEGREKGAIAAAELLSRGRKECEAVEARAVSSADVLERNILLDAKSALIDEIYVAALEKLRTLPDDRYFEFLCGLLSRSVDGIGEEEDDGYGYVNPNGDLYVVALNEADGKRFGKALVDSAKEKVAGKKCRIELSGRSAGISGGMIVRRGDVEINASLEMLVKGVREETESTVCRILFSL